MATIRICPICRSYNIRPVSRTELETCNNCGMVYSKPKSRTASKAFIFVKTTDYSGLVLHSTGDKIPYRLPGGKAEANEKPTQTLTRELFEELGIADPNMEPERIKSLVQYAAGEGTWLTRFFEIDKTYDIAELLIPAGHTIALVRLDSNEKARVISITEDGEVQVEEKDIVVSLLTMEQVNLWHNGVLSYGK